MRVKDLLQSQESLDFTSRLIPMEPTFRNPLPTPPPRIFSSTRLDSNFSDTKKDDRWEMLVHCTPTKPKQIDILQIKEESESESFTFNKAFKCPHVECGKIFTRSQNLNSHLSVHSGERPYVCTYEGCQGKFRRKQDLFRHTRSIHMPFSSRPYACPSDGCLMRFARADGLNAHVKKCGSSSSLRSNRRKKTAYAGTSFGKALEE